MRKIALKFVFFLIFYFIYLIPLIPQAAVSANQVFRTGIVSRIEFAPEVLDSIRHELNHCISSFSTSLSFITIEEFTKSGHDTGFDLILVEKGLTSEALKNSYSSSENRLLMGWVLVAKGKALELTGMKLENLHHFTEILKKLRTDSPYKFPWFEPLSSRSTLINFCRILGEAPLNISEKKNSQQPVWQEKNAIGFLYRCIEEELLNPMSVEADLALSNSVLAADDTYFSTTWVPLRQLIKQVADKNSGYIIFPDLQGKKRIPTISLDLWHRNSLKVNIASLSPEVYDFADELLEMDFSIDQEWFKSNYQNQYDALIMGNF